ncbi:PfkB family carbohydrate kinase [Roseivirga sp. BDSF3-8]|uniref:PfkB family carbohydrate kinase n=1 Tax=Roseivirga sp. BDSF3-8 TaxID=3241598 RepID=UPI0035317F19
MSDKPKKVVLFGEVLLRLSPPGHQRFRQAACYDAIYGGSELNVALSLSHFGLRTDYITRLPDNALSDCVIEKLRGNGVSTGHIVYGGDRLGLYFIEIGAGHRGSRVVYDRAFSSMTTIEKGMVDWQKVLKGADWFHWSGITAGISATAAEVCAEAIEAARQMGVIVSTDFNYRNNLWHYGRKAGEVMEPLVGSSDVAIVGEYACKQYFDIAPEPGEDCAQELSVRLRDRFPALQRIAVTSREVISASHNKWSGELFGPKGRHRSATYDISDITDRIGTGDSFTAGLIYGLLQGQDDQQAVEFATAASCLKHTIFGDANLVSVQEVEDLMKGDRVGQVSR